MQDHKWRDWPWSPGAGPQWPRWPILALVSCTQDLNLALDPGDTGLRLLTQSINILVDGGDIGLGGQVGVEQMHLLVGQDFGLLLGKAVLGQMLDEPMGVKGNRFEHGRP